MKSWLEVKAANQTQVRNSYSKNKVNQDLIYIYSGDRPLKQPGCRHLLVCTVLNASPVLILEQAEGIRAYYQLNYFVIKTIQFRVLILEWYQLHCKYLQWNCGIIAWYSKLLQKKSVAHCRDTELFYRRPKWLCFMLPTGGHVFFFGLSSRSFYLDQTIFPFYCVKIENVKRLRSLILMPDFSSQRRL